MLRPVCLSVRLSIRPSRLDCDSLRPVVAHFCFLIYSKRRDEIPTEL